MYFVTNNYELMLEHINFNTSPSLPKKILITEIYINHFIIKRYNRYIHFYQNNVTVIKVGLNF